VAAEDPRAPAPMFAQVGRAELRGGQGMSRAMLLVVAVGLGAATLSLLWELQLGAGSGWLRPPVRVTYMADPGAAP
jgi:hypothetical protein